MLNCNSIAYLIAYFIKIGTFDIFLHRKIRKPCNSLSYSFKHLDKLLLLLDCIRIRNQKCKLDPRKNKIDEALQNASYLSFTQH